MDAREYEYQHWKDSANILLLALTVLFAASLVIDPKTGWSFFIVPIFFGLLGIVLVVIWFAFDTKFKVKGRPVCLWWGTCAFCVQVITLFISLLIAYSSAE